MLSFLFLNSLQCQLYPRYKKAGASSLIPLGFQNRLIGGISARPFFPYAEQLMDNLDLYSSLSNQEYLLNVRLEAKLCPLSISHVILMHQFLFPKVNICINVSKSVSSATSNLPISLPFRLESSDLIFNS